MLLFVFLYLFLNEVFHSIHIYLGAETPAARLLVLSQFIRHPNYNPDDLLVRDDIAVVVTSDVIQFNQLVGPACLPFRYYNQDFTGKTVELLGKSNYGDIHKNRYFFIYLKSICLKFYIYYHNSAI